MRKRASFGRSAGTQHRPASIAARASPGGMTASVDGHLADARQPSGEQAGDLLATGAGEAGDAEHLAGGHLEVEVAAPWCRAGDG